jgi:HPt (histidine-containing phosphotransfer) domain-containing protein
MMTDAPRLDTRKALDNLAGDVELYAEVAGVFFEDIPQQLSDLDAALVAKDYPTARRVAHTIKGMAATVGGQRLHFAALALEQACMAADVQSIALTDPVMRAECVETTTALHDFLAGA